MTRQERVSSLQSYLDVLYPHTECFLHSNSEFSFLVAVILSAQAQDKVVNQVTPILFQAYPDVQAMAKAKPEDVLVLIKRVGLGPSKAKNIVALAQDLNNKYQGQIPHERPVLETLPGVGHKTAGVFLGEIDQAEVIPVDTHINRICLRLGICRQKDTPAEIEKTLEKYSKPSDKMNFHRQMILFGRNICLANSKRLCEHCPLKFCLDRKK